MVGYAQVKIERDLRRMSIKNARQRYYKALQVG